MIAWLIVLILLFCVIALYQNIQKKDQNIQKERLKYVLDTSFIATFEDVGMDSVESQLNKIFSKADKEIIIVSPWIKWGAWSRIDTKLYNFVNAGGTLKLFTKGGKKDYLGGFSDREVINRIKNIGGEVIFVPKLHAKIVVIDRQEAIITSANFTNGGLDFNYEAGIWTRNPHVVNRICWFIDELKLMGQTL